MWKQILLLKILYIINYEHIFELIFLFEWKIRAIGPWYQNVDILTLT